MLDGGRNVQDAPWTHERELETKKGWVLKKMQDMSGNHQGECYRGPQEEGGIHQSVFAKRRLLCFASN